MKIIYKNLLLTLVLLLTSIHLIAQERPFITVWDTSISSSRIGATNTTIAVPIIGDNYTIVWEEVSNPANNGTITNISSTQLTPYILNLPIQGKYRIKVYRSVGNIRGFTMYSGGIYTNRYDNLRLLLVEQWGDIIWQNIASAFYGARNLDVVATDIPNLIAVKSLGSMFYGCEELKYENGTIANWDVSNVITMSNMFNNAFKFNQDISRWDVSNVTDMNAMFSRAFKFNQNISGWQVDKVTNMAQMFNSASLFNQDLSQWKVNNVRDMRGMFSNASEFTSDLSRWQVDNVTNMSHMFNFATSFTSTLDNWNVSNVTSMSYMFNGVNDFTSDLSRWKVDNCTDFSYMFGRCYKFESNLSNWKVDKSTAFEGMFYQAEKFNSDLSNWKVGNATNMKSMFYKAYAFTSDVSRWDVSKVQFMESMFYAVRNFNSDISNWNVQNVTKMIDMFWEARSFNQDLSRWNLRSLEDAHNMLGNTAMSCENYSATLTGWASNPNTPSRAIRFGAANIRYNRTGWVGLNELIKKNWVIVTPGIYDRLCGGVDISTDFVTVWNTTNAGATDNTKIAFPVIGSNYVIEWEKLPSSTVLGGVIVTSSTVNNPYILDLSTYGPGQYRIRAYNGRGAITGFRMSADETIYDNKKLIRVERWGNVVWQTLNSAFVNAVNMDITATDSPDLSNITDLTMMFYACKSLKYNASINNWDVSKVTNMSNMFFGTEVFDQPLNDWDVSKVTSMNNMFARTKKFDRPLFNWKTNNVIDMSYMFYFATAFNKSLNDWDVSKVRTMKHMFSSATNFNQTFTSWNLTALTNAENMFDRSGIDCSNYSATLSAWGNNSNTPNSIKLSAIGLSYNNTGKVGRDILANIKLWVISGDNYDATCGGQNNVWVGTISSYWDEPNNWSSGNLPEEDTDIEFATAANNNGVEAMNNLMVDDNRFIGKLINASNRSLIIPIQSSLTVKDMILGSETADKADKIQIEAGKNKINGSLIVFQQPQNTPVHATVQFYSKAKKERTSSKWIDNVDGSPTKGTEFETFYRWQFFGIPVESIKPDPTFFGAFLREYDEGYNGEDNTKFYQKWRKIGNNSTLTAFKGYEITQNSPKTYYIQGRLYFGDKQLTMSRKAPKVTTASNPSDKINHWGLGKNIFGNSYTSAINIRKIEFPEEVEKTVYIYNTGSFADWGKRRNNIATEESNSNPGVYIAVPQSVASTIFDNRIPSMQGFLLKFKDDETIFNGPDAVVTLKYTDGGVNNNTKPQRIAAKDSADNALGHIQVFLESKTSEDKMWLIETPEATDNFDNGYDGYKLLSQSPSASIFTELNNDQLQISSTDVIVGKTFSFRSNSDRDYTLTLVKKNLGHYDNLHLLDLKTHTYLPLTNDTTSYSFVSNNNGLIEKRFVIVNESNTTIDIDNNPSYELIDIYMADHNILITNNMTTSAGTITLSDVSGRTVMQSNIKQGFNQIPVSLSTGVYMVIVKTETKTKIVKVLI